MSTFKNLEEQKVISIEIERTTKAKSKKIFGKFIDHLIGKSLSVSNIDELNSLQPKLPKSNSLNPNIEKRGSELIPNKKK